MSETLTTIFSNVVDRLHLEATTHLPALIAAAIIIFAALAIATATRRILYRIFKGTGLDRFLRRTGIAHMIDPSGELRATRITAETAYWSVLILGFLAGLSVFGTDLTSQLIEKFVFLIPRLVVAGLIMLAGVWLSQYLSRWMLVWAFTENLPHPRRLGVAVRVAVLFIATVVTADYLDFARSVFLTAFIIFMGGLVLTVSLAVGIGGAGRVRSYLQENRLPEGEKRERELWTHL